jgi:hypothetical protein
MSRFKKVVRNIIILAILLFLFLLRGGLYLTPLSAHEHSERSIHYGPSEVVHIEDFDKGKYILGRYDKWVSCNTVKRQLFFFWGFGNQPTGFEFDKTKALDYSWGISHQYYKLYGIINDNRVNKIQITLDNGKIFTQTEFYDDLFLFTWKSDNSKEGYFKNIKGYDSDNNVIFEEEY